MLLSSLILIILATATSGQQVYITTTGPSPRPYCTPSPVLSHGENKTSASYYFTPFSYTQTETVRFATPLASMAASTYGPAYSDISGLLPNLSTTSWGNWDPSARSSAAPTDTARLFGQSAYSALWMRADLQNFTRGLYSTTLSPTPVPTAELVLPPPLFFGPRDCYSVPKDFMFGVSGSASQIEGAVADEGRSPAVLDFLAEFAANLPVQTTGGIDIDNDFTTTENYYLYKQDIERLAAIGIRYYSFSISWTRILPFAVPGSPVNSDGLKHYDDLINFVIEKGMQPVVTLTHFDTPAQFIGGNWTGLLERTYYGNLNYGYQGEEFLDAFVNYGKIVMTHFADRVPLWITFNEPQVGCISGPSIDHIIKSHARLYHFYHKEIGGKGKISMKISTPPGIPQDPANASHVAATEHYNDFNIGPFLYPLALGRDYPESFKMTIQDYIPLSNDDLAQLNGTLDFIGIDTYQATSVSPINDTASCAADNSTSNEFYPNCVHTSHITVNGWSIGYNADYIAYEAPTYLRTQLNYLWNKFKLPIVITEFGMSISTKYPPADLDDQRFDIERSEFYLSYLTEVLKSIWEDGVHVMGAFMWSFLDNWELGTYSHQFGLQYVNRTTQQRVYRRSLFDVVDFMESRRIEG